MKINTLPLSDEWGFGLEIAYSRNPLINTSQPVLAVGRLDRLELDRRISELWNVFARDAERVVTPVGMIRLVWRSAS